VHRDRGYARFVSGIYELGAIGDSGRPDLKPIFAPRAEDGRARATGAGMLSEALAERLTAVGFDLNWLHPDASDWPTGLLRQERAS
jgi:pilus assembly protein CpaF